MKKLLQLLDENKRIPMHMPGHKRNIAVAHYLKRLGADLDITEIDGFDNLHSAEGVLKDAMKRTAALRGADRAFYLVNGTTSGILAAICALVTRGDKVICARNCHKSVYNAIELAGAEPIFVLPRADAETGILGPVESEDIEKKLTECVDAKLVILTSPTYEGVVSDIEKISGICRKMGVILLVDGAHGAHLGFGHGFPTDAISCGADVSVESLHKTLPSLTQTAVCYCRNELAGKIAEKLAVFESSSPSYLLMASIDGCTELIRENGEELFSAWQKRLKKLYESLENLQNIRVWDGGSFEKDPSKIVLLCENGVKLSDVLRHMGIECEMALSGYTLAMTGMGDTDETTELFAKCVLEADREVRPQEKTYKKMNLPIKILSVSEALTKKKEALSPEYALGKISAGYVWAYPPGVPYVVPGELIGQDEIELFLNCKSAGVELFCSNECEKGKILVIK